MASIKRARGECLRLSVLGANTAQRAPEFQSLSKEAGAPCVIVRPQLAEPLELRALTWSINNNKKHAQGTGARARKKRVFSFSPGREAKSPMPVNKSLKEL
jgi:hypothetical protein